jgi:PST family polysaccharide transporter
VSLRSQAIQQGRYLYLREGIGILVRAGGMILLTRMIGPTQYGLFASPALVNIFLVTVVLTGMDTVLIRRPGLSDEWFHFVFTYLLITSVIVGAVGVAFSHQAGGWLGDPRMAAPFAAMCASLPLNVLWAPGRAKLEREMDYKHLAWVEMSSDASQYAVSLSLAAFAGMGVWAAVWGYLMRQLVLLLGVYMLTSYRPKLHWDNKLLKQGLSLGAGFSGGQLSQRAGDMVVPIVVGRYLGARDVGIAALTVRLAETLSFVNRASYRLGVVALGRIRNDKKRLRRAVGDLQAMQVLSVGPMLTGFALSAWFVVPLFLGDRWHRVIGLFPFIAINYLINALFTAQTAALAANGRSWIVMRNSVINTALLFSAALILVPRYGLTGYAISETIGIGAQYFNHQATKKLLGQSANYRGALPWVILLVPPLFAPAVEFPYSVLCVAIPLLILAVPQSRREVVRQVRMVTDGTRLRGKLGKRGKGAHSVSTGSGTSGPAAAVGTGSAQTTDSQADAGALT